MTISRVNILSASLVLGYALQTSAFAAPLPATPAPVPAVRFEKVTAKSYVVCDIYRRAYRFKKSGANPVKDPGIEIPGMLEEINVSEAPIEQCDKADTGALNILRDYSRMTDEPSTFWKHTTRNRRVVTRNEITPLDTANLSESTENCLAQGKSSYDRQIQTYTIDAYRSFIIKGIQDFRIRVLEIESDDQKQSAPLAIEDKMFLSLPIYVKSDGTCAVETLADFFRSPEEELYNKMHNILN